MSNIIIKPERLSGGDPRVEFTGSLGGTSKIVVGPYGGLEFTLDYPGQEYSFLGGPISMENLVVDGDLTVNGAMTTVNTVNLEVKDAVIGLGFASGTVSISPPGDRGLIASLNVDDHVAFLWKNVESEFALGRTQSSATGSIPVGLTSYSNLHIADLQASIITASLGFTGSLTKLTDGTDYLRAGTGIDISTGSSGYVTITSTAVTSPASPDTSVQFNNSNAFDGDATFTFVVGQDAYSNPMGQLYLTGTLAQGDGTKALGWHAHAEGYNTIAYGMNSHAEGNATATGDSIEGGGGYAHSEGNATVAYGSYSHAEGNATLTGGRWNLTGTLGGGSHAHAEGDSTVAFGYSSHAEGSNTKTGAMDSAGNWSGGDYAHAEGSGGTIAWGEGSHAEGYGTQTGIQNDLGVWSGGQNAHAEGMSTYAVGSTSHAEGQSTKTLGVSSHAEGYATIAGYGNGPGDGAFSHAEGQSTITSGSYSHAEGGYAITRGAHSHAEGYYTVTEGTYSHAAGIYTIASGSGQNVVGKYNKRDNADSLFVIGNGDGDADVNRSDIFLVNTGSVLIGSASLSSDTFFYVGTKGDATGALFDGNAVVSGTLNVKNGSDLSVLSVNGSKVGIGTESPTYKLEVNGDFAATTKSFVINHPSKPGWKLRHGSLEGPENGVYVRGKSSSAEILLPSYWKDLVLEDSITVQITPIGRKQGFFVTSVSTEKIVLQPDSKSTKSVEYFYFVQAERKDATLTVEYEEA